MHSSNTRFNEQDTYAVDGWHARSAQDVLRELSVSEHDGLEQEQIRQRLAAHGLNSLPATQRRSAWLRFALQFHNPLIYVLLAAGAVTAALGDHVDAGVILGVVWVNALVGFVQEGKAERALDAVRAMLPRRAMVVRQGVRQEVDAAQLVPGDIAC